jgi:hypothetical protein
LQRRKDEKQQNGNTKQNDEDWKRKTMTGIEEGVMAVMSSLRNLLFHRIGISENDVQKHQVTPADSAKRPSKPSVHIVKNETSEEVESPNQADSQDTILPPAPIPDATGTVTNANVPLELTREEESTPDVPAN